jgi:hypothetical protein
MYLIVLKRIVRCLLVLVATGIFPFFVDQYGSMKGKFKPKPLKKGCCSNYLCNVIAREVRPWQSYEVQDTYETDCFGESASQ